MIHFENGFEFGIRKRWDDRLNVWAEMNSASVGIEPTREQPNEFSVHTILGVFNDLDSALNFVSRLSGKLQNEFRVHAWKSK